MSRILILDDDVSLCETLQSLLSPTYRCDYAHRIQDGRKYLAENPDTKVVLLDLSLPDGSGDIIVDELAHSQIQVIVLTMTSDVRRATALMAKGAYYYLTKDSAPEEILQTVAKAVARSSQVGTGKTIDSRLDALSQEVNKFHGSLREELWLHRERESLLKDIDPKAKLRKIVQEFEKRLLLAALEKNDWRRHITAQALGMHINTLLLKLKRYGITDSSHKRSSTIA